MQGACEHTGPLPPFREPRPLWNLVRVLLQHRRDLRVKLDDTLLNSIRGGAPRPALGIEELFTNVNCTPFHCFLDPRRNATILMRA